MTKKTLRNLILFNSFLCLANILLFARPFLRIFSFGNILLTSLGVTAIALSGVAFFVVNSKILAANVPPPLPKPVDPGILTLDDCAVAAQRYISENTITFAADLQNLIGQVDRLKRKKGTVETALLEKFSDTEMSFEKFHTAVENIEKLMIQGIRSLIARIEAFDEEEYEDLIFKQSRSGAKNLDPLTESRMKIYYDYIAYVKKVVENNEQMLLKIDQLILEITKLNTLNVGEVENMDAIRQIEELIGNAKWYK